MTIDFAIEPLGGARCTPRDLEDLHTQILSDSAFKKEMSEKYGISQKDLLANVRILFQQAEKRDLRKT